MSELIVYHYGLSPFSQKIRTMLGYAQLPWTSVTVRELPPRPALAKLAGGYRKIPVAQTGADVFCDTRIIASEIAALSGKPELALENCTAEVQEYVARVDLEIFLACAMNAGSRKAFAKARATMSWPDLILFVWDRISIGRKAQVKTVGLKRARALALEHFQQLENRLETDFLFGAQPNHADFSTWHSLWLIREMAESTQIDAYPKLMAWMDRMKAMGEGASTPKTSQQTLEIARQATPRELPDEWKQDARIGRRVSIAPTDYCCDPTVGTLAGSSETRWVIAREHEPLGRLHVHFPKQGFNLQVT